MKFRKYEIEQIDVLDKGYVRIVDHMGDDLAPVNDARVSFDKQVDEFTDKDIRLLHFLGSEGHTSPFRHSFLKFEVYAPLMVARQWWKYVIGSDHAEQPMRDYDSMTAWNESSRRYITENVEFYIVAPDQWRSQPENKKQGSGEPLPLEVGAELTKELIAQYENGQRLYEEAIAKGVAVEQARLFLPAYGLYVRWKWTASLQGVGHFLNQRLPHDAQKEIQDYAKAVETLAKQPFPNSIESLKKNI